MFWKVAGFSQPSPIEQILDKEEFTLEELLDEDDIIQECKSLNGRLVAFLRERSTVEQLIKYLVEEAHDSDDPKRTYKYPFTACEVFCCEVEAVFNTVLDDEELMRLLFSLLDSEPPLNCKTAGYFGRVIGHLLLRKTNEMLQYLQDQPAVLEKLIRHVDTTSIADIIKRLVGADEPSSMLFIPAYAQWLSETNLVDLLLERLGDTYSADVQTNAADILSATAHTQPSPLATKLTHETCVKALFQHALSPGQQVLVPALEVCIALIEPKRSNQDLMADGSPLQDSARRVKSEAVNAIVQHLPKLVELLQHEDTSITLETTYGMLSPPLGRSRLKIVELMAVLMRSGDVTAERAIKASASVPVCLQLFRKYPFNNLLHHYVAAMIIATVTRASEGLVPYFFEQCALLDWLVSLPQDIKPESRPGQDNSSKQPLRAGYLGHVTQLASTLESIASSQHLTEAEAVNRVAICNYLEGSQAWQSWLESDLHPRQDTENTSHWQCGRPVTTDLTGLDSDGDEYQNDMEMETIQGMQPALYHRYNVVDEGDEDDEDSEYKDEYKASGFNTHLMTEALSGMDINDSPAMEVTEDADEMGRGSASSAEAPATAPGIDDDEVLLATSDDEEQAPDDAESQMQAADGSPLEKAAPSSSTDDMVIVEDIPEGLGQNAASKPYSDANFWKPTWTGGASAQE